MSFANCTGTTADSCRSPCQLVYTSDERDPVCVPPRSVPAETLSDADLDRIKQLINFQTSDFDQHLRALHDTLYEYVDTRVRAHTELALLDENTPRWKDVLEKIAADVMNDTGHLHCGICIEGFNKEHGEVKVLKCTRGGGNNCFPMHADCYRDMTTTYRDGQLAEKCPMCRETVTELDHSFLDSRERLLSVQRQLRAFATHSIILMMFWLIVPLVVRSMQGNSLPAVRANQAPPPVHTPAARMPEVARIVEMPTVIPGVDERVPDVVRINEMSTAPWASIPRPDEPTPFDPA